MYRVLFWRSVSVAKIPGIGQCIGWKIGKLNGQWENSLSRIHSKINSYFGIIYRYKCRPGYWITIVNIRCNKFYIENSRRHISMLRIYFMRNNSIAKIPAKGISCLRLVDETDYQWKIAWKRISSQIREIDQQGCITGGRCTAEIGGGSGTGNGYIICFWQGICFILIQGNQWYSVTSGIIVSMSRVFQGRSQAIAKLPQVTFGINSSIGKTDHQRVNPG